MTIPPPTHLSRGGSGYLLEPDVLDYPTDWSDPWAVQEFRDYTNRLWATPNAGLDFDYEVQHEALAGVAVERISAGPVHRGVALLHFHGGMYCLGTPEIDRVLNAPLARASGIEIVSVDYRLAPEHRFPAAVDDAVAVYRALVGDGARVAVFGESAGGGLAAACALAVREEGLAAPAALGLISPMLDLTGSSDTYATLAPVDPDYADTSVLLDPAAVYAGSTPLDHPLVSPLFADLCGLPPTCIQVGSREVLLGDSVRFARAARAAGVDVDLHVQDAGWHNYPIWYGVPEADAAVESLARFFTRALSLEAV